MKRRIVGLLLTLAVGCAAGAGALTLGTPLEGITYMPEGTDASSAQFIYRYSYPQIQGEDDTALGINAFYQYQAEDALAFLAPMEAEHHQRQGTTGEVSISHQIMRHDEAFFSVVTTMMRSSQHVSEPPVCRGQTFALTGEKAGQVVSLPYLLGVLDAGETDEWLLDRQVKKANQLVRNMVWDALQQMEVSPAGAWTREALDTRFFPEEDFYLDDAGRIVFFLQPTQDAPWITIPLTKEAILDKW